MYEDIVLCYSMCSELQRIIRGIAAWHTKPPAYPKSGKGSHRLLYYTQPCSDFAQEDVLKTEPVTFFGHVTTLPFIKALLFTKSN